MVSILNVFKKKTNKVSLDEQSEEFANFITQSSALDEELVKCIEHRSKNKQIDDSTAKTLFQMKNANSNLFLAGSKKAVSRRKGDAAINAQYYAIVF